MKLNLDLYPVVIADYATSFDRIRDPIFCQACSKLRIIYISYIVKCVGKFSFMLQYMHIENMFASSTDISIYHL